MARTHVRHTFALTALAVLAFISSAASAAVLFDDFSYSDSTALRAQGWQPRETAGHPGPTDAKWSPEHIALVDDPTRPGNRLLRLTATTDGTATGTQQSQLCHSRKFFRGTYAARVRFSDEPVIGPDGDTAVQAFYAIGALRHDLDPDFSEVDFEYLPNGGWGSERTRLYGISWHSVQIEPWRAFNSAHEVFGSLAGWHVLVIVVEEHQTRHYLDGKLLKRHGGRNVPVTPMSLNFSLWFSPSGFLQDPTVRRYSYDVDWVLHIKDRSLSPRAVSSIVHDFRRRGVTRHDSVPMSTPALASECRL